MGTAGAGVYDGLAEGRPAGAEGRLGRDGSVGAAGGDGCMGTARGG